MSVGPALLVVKTALEANAIPYMVVGSFASSIHGDPHSTFDLDLVIDPDREKLDAFVRRLPERFYVDADVARDAFARRSMFNAIDSETGWKIDLIIRKARAFSIEELARKQPGVIAGVDVFVATPEDTILAKLEWARDGASERQLDDVRRVIAVQRGALDRTYIARWIAELGLAAQWAAVIA